MGRKLHVEVVSAAGLAAKHTGVPYCTLEIDGQIKRIAAKNKDHLNPIFNTVVEFEVPPNVSMEALVLTVTILCDSDDRKKSLPIFLGKVNISGAHFANRGDHALVFYQLKRKGILLTSQVSGEVGLKLWWSDNDREERVAAPPEEATPPAEPAPPPAKPAAEPVTVVAEPVPVVAVAERAPAAVAEPAPPPSPPPEPVLQLTPPAAPEPTSEPASELAEPAPIVVEPAPSPAEPAPIVVEPASVVVEPAAAPAEPKAEAPVAKAEPPKEEPLVAPRVEPVQAALEPAPEPKPEEPVPEPTPAHVHEEPNHVHEEPNHVHEEPNHAHYECEHNHDHHEETNHDHHEETNHVYHHEGDGGPAFLWMSSSSGAGSNVVVCNSGNWQYYSTNPSNTRIISFRRNNFPRFF